MGRECLLISNEQCLGGRHEQDDHSHCRDCQYCRSSPCCPEARGGEMFGLLDWRRHRRRRNRRRAGVAGLRLWLSSVWLRLSGVRLCPLRLRACLLWVRAATLLCTPLLPLLSHTRLLPLSRSRPPRWPRIGGGGSG